MRHVPVLLKEVVELFDLKKDLRVVDCTLGDGGHSEAILEKIGPTGKLLGIDADTESLLRTKCNLYRFENQTEFVHDNFAQLQEILTRQQFAPVDRILMDFGWSTPQFAERGRGFSFEGSEPLDMRYGSSLKTRSLKLACPSELKRRGETQGETAADIINQASVEELVKIFKKFGEEPLSHEVAMAIVEERKKAPIALTNELVEIILQTYRVKLKTSKEIPWIGGLHPATKVFQALRIAVNHELEVIEQALPQATAALVSGGRLAVISFHSLEDRIVKHFFQRLPAKLFKIITKKPVVASVEEIALNPSSRSAKLRVIEKI